MSTNDSYRTIEKPVEGLYKEKGSKFIARAFCVNNEQEIKDVQAQLRNEYYDARHHCYAYCLGKGGERYRANDDGEPNHSAGDPILGQIRSNDLTNVLVVVIRYFGGTKLGVGGLITAYKTATAEALETANIITKHWKVLYKLSFGYNEYNSLMPKIKEWDAVIVNQEYSGDKVMMELEFREGVEQQFLDFVSDLLDTKVEKLKTKN